METTGSNEQFTTGAVRDVSASKPRPDLISPFMLLRLGEWLRLGAERYAPRNWEQGMNVSRCWASLMRHVCKWAAGFREEDHLAAIIFNAMAIVHYEEMVKRGILPESLLDMPDYGKKNET